ncbi:SprT family zinc-dependent metalloprotease [Deinococcus sonorensis]|uniref:SprT family zinc-dependent metalloprotease n=2 Tax=Deinococcus sonorensis TaxID=309891 RepID=A0AAU7UDR0_9DEIO
MSRPPILTLGDLAVELRRSARRRTVALKVGPAGAVLYAPTTVPQAQLERFLAQKEDWMRRHLASLAPPVVAPLHSGRRLPLLDEQLELRLGAPGRSAVREDQLLWLPATRPGAALEGWYRQQARAYFTPLVHRLSEQLGRPVRAVRLTSAQTRWGSCTATGDIRLHWRLMLAPQRVAEYVAAHEVAHLQELNHSARYWRVVARLMPDYPQQRAWLRQHGAQLPVWPPD